MLSSRVYVYRSRPIYILFFFLSWILLINIKKEKIVCNIYIYIVACSIHFFFSFVRSLSRTLAYNNKISLRMLRAPTNPSLMASLSLPRRVSPINATPEEKERAMPNWYIVSLLVSSIDRVSLKGSIFANLSPALAHTCGGEGGGWCDDGFTDHRLRRGELPARSPFSLFSPSSLDVRRT